MRIRDSMRIRRSTRIRGSTRIKGVDENKWIDKRRDHSEEKLPICKNTVWVQVIFKSLITTLV